MFNLENKRVLITGGFGFIGTKLSDYLQSYCKVKEVMKFGSARFGKINFDLTHSFDAQIAFGYSDSEKFDVIFHLAGVTGNVKSHGKRPVDSFVDNTLMGLNVLRACHKYKVKKVVSVIASCAYPRCEWRPVHRHSEEHEIYLKEVMGENDLFDGPPDESVEAHAYAKRNLQLASKYYHQQYGCDFVCVCPPTVYGPGDSFDPSKTKVMGSLIAKFCTAMKEHKQEVVCWGTGAPLREFIYIDDCVRLLAQSVNYNNSNIPLNIGSGQEVSIKSLAELIAKTVGYTGRIIWDSKEPEGQQRKLLDSSRIGPQTFTSLEEGIRRTVAWYQENVN